MQVELQISARLDAFLANGGAAVRAAIARGLGDAGKDLEAAVKKKLRANKSIKTGTLLRSIGYAVDERELSLRVGTLFARSPLVYAAQVEFGGPIPKSETGRLAWPVSREYGGVVPTKAGVFGGSVQTARFDLGATSTFVRPSRSGRTRILFFKGPQFGAKGYAPAFVLASRVNQPGKPYLVPTVREMLPRVLEQIHTALIGATAF